MMGVMWHAHWFASTSRESLEAILRLQIVRSPSMPFALQRGFDGGGAYHASGDAHAATRAQGWIDLRAS